MNLKYVKIKLDHFDAKTGIIKGYGAIFGNRDAHGDIITQGAFDETLKKQDVSDIKMLYQHNMSRIPGIWTKIKADSVGLAVEGQLFPVEHSLAKDVRIEVASKALDGLSIGFITVQEHFDREFNSNMLTELDTKEVSLVTFPANNLARISEIKTKHDLALYKRHIENILSDSGIPMEEAQAILSKGISHLLVDVQSDSDNSENWAEVGESIESYKQQLTG